MNPHPPATAHPRDGSLLSLESEMNHTTWIRYMFKCISASVQNVRVVISMDASTHSTIKVNLEQRSCGFYKANTNRLITTRIQVSI